ncbi:hypothetical protein PILCRDRAFT_824879 [Piloderma croceum F 1598]|uniref:Uncharacterized protein n=1 Tax=Piloderma croceum (strain F 1598) TaxID=765440 RepID=A0A0C3AV84_PILCF|nr:hypothetical protein PILCRDRAFT_824879 [Piloderma croceum F 1598]
MAKFNRRKCTGSVNFSVLYESFMSISSGQRKKPANSTQKSFKDRLHSRTRWSSSAMRSRI